MKAIPRLLNFFLILISLNCFAQRDTTFLSRAVDSLQKKTGSYPAEKVYLHLDKPKYTLGDTIWFKAYTVIGGHHRLSALSGVLYVELSDAGDTVITRKILHLQAGVAWGDITLNKNKPGLYHLRAYTNWMRNAGAEYFYDQPLQVGGFEAAPNISKQTSPQNPDVQFFPEGGDLVAGIRSKVAIKAVDANGTGTDIKGSIVDNDGNVVADFATTHLGMGIFALTPQSGKTYKAKITGTGEAGFTVDLPAVKTTGFTLAINNSRPDSIFLKVAVNGQLFKEKQNTRFYIVGQAAGVVYYTAAGKLENPVFTAMIGKGRFSSGIVQFTLFSENGEPMNERIAFIRSKDMLDLKLSGIADTYTTRQKVTIGLGALNAAGQPVTGTFSVAVINESRIGAEETAESTILNNLLLTSDLKGTVEQPDYYFINPNNQTDGDLDVLMLTQGYRRFEWTQILNKANPLIAYQPEKLPELSGTVKTPGGKPVPNRKISLMALRQGLVIDSVTDAAGNFRFTNLDLPDTAKIALSASKGNDSKNIAIYVKQADYPPVVKHKGLQLLPPYALSALLNDTVSSQNDTLAKVKQLKEVTIKDKKIAKSDLYNLYGTKEERFVDMKKLQEYPSLEDAIKGTQGLITMAFKGHNNAIGSINVLVDGMAFHLRDLDAYLPEEIESVAIVNSTRSNNPLIVVSTKRVAGTDTTVLKKVTITAKKIYKRPEVTHSDNLNGPGQANQVIMGSELQGCVTLMDCLVGKVMGVTVKNGKFLNTRATARINLAYMVLIVDGMIMDFSHINDLDAENINSIEVLRSANYLTIYGTNASGGALVITTKKAGDENYVTSVKPQGLITYPFKGFYKARAFYSPKYTSAKTGSSAPDLRSTIYWKPDIITDKDGKASFEYFNADPKGTYRIVIEGLDADGNLGREVYKYKVE